MPVQTAKVLLAVAGMVVFFAGTRTGFGWLRWSGIALVAIAWVLRYYRPSRPMSDVPTSSEELQ